MVGDTRANAQQAQMQGQQDVNLPDSIRISLNTMSLMKGLALRWECHPPDERAHVHALVSNMPIPQSIPFIYPRMYALHDMDAKCGTIVDDKMAKVHLGH